MQYEAHPIFPPPLIFISHLLMVIDKCRGRRKKGRFRADRGLKLFLNENEEENLHDWEEDLVDDYYRLKRREDGKRFEEQMKASAEKILKIERHLDEKEMRDQQIRSTIYDMSQRLDNLGVPAESLLVEEEEEFLEPTANQIISDDIPNFDLTRWKGQKRLQRLRRDSEMSHYAIPDFSPESEKDIEHQFRKGRKWDLGRAR